MTLTSHRVVREPQERKAAIQELPPYKLYVCDVFYRVLLVHQTGCAWSPMAVDRVAQNQASDIGCWQVVEKALGCSLACLAGSALSYERVSTRCSDAALL